MADFRIGDPIDKIADPIDTNADAIDSVGVWEVFYCAKFGSYSSLPQLSQVISASSVSSRLRV
jgi:hypothetical protein